MNKKSKSILLLAAVATATTSTFAAKAEMKETPAAVSAVSAEDIQKETPFKWGGDFRFRTVYFDNIPYSNIPVESRGGANSFQRYRTRLFGEYHPRDDLYFRGRLVNEFRTYQTPDNQSWSAMDETVIDNLFVDYSYEDIIDLRVGRQDLIYGTGKLILDGTPKDGSRTIYFDAAKASYKGIENTTVDFLGMYTYAQDRLAIHTQDRDIVGMTGGKYEGAEAGYAVYVKNKTYEDLPWEAYYISKTKGQVPASLAAVEQDGPINCFGGRLMPKWAEGTFSANVEAAYQSSKTTSEFMLDALVNWNISSMEEQKAKLGLGWYYLSEDWNPLFARWPQYSELYVYSFDTTGAGAWQNISMPHIDFSISPFKNYKADFLLGYMFAPEDNGLGSGHNRGLLFTWWNKFTLAEKILSDKDKLSGHFLIELMEPGDYYSDAQREQDIASFIRLELGYAF